MNNYVSNIRNIKMQSVCREIGSARAIYHNVREDPREVAFEVGDILDCVQPSDEAGWFTGTVRRSGESGLFPLDYVEIINQEAEEVPETDLMWSSWLSINHLTHIDNALERSSASEQTANPKPNQRQVRNTATTHPPILKPEMMSQDDFERYREYFRKNDTFKLGKITGGQCRRVFTLSGLPEGTLADIWDLCDMDKDGHLNEREFISAMFWIARTRNERAPVPETLDQRWVSWIQNKSKSGSTLPAIKSTSIKKQTLGPPIAPNGTFKSSNSASNVPKNQVLTLVASHPSPPSLPARPAAPPSGNISTLPSIRPNGASPSLPHRPALLNKSTTSPQTHSISTEKTPPPLATRPMNRTIMGPRAPPRQPNSVAKVPEPQLLDLFVSSISSTDANYSVSPSNQRQDGKAPEDSNRFKVKVSSKEVQKKAWENREQVVAFAMSDVGKAVAGTAWNHREKIADVVEITK